MVLPVRWPLPGEWIKVNPDLDQQTEASLILGDDGEYILIDPSIAKEMKKRKHFKPLQDSVIFMACNGEGEFFLWPIPKPIEYDHPVYLAMENWVCFQMMPTKGGPQMNEAERKAASKGMAKVNTVLHLYRDGTIDRKTCKAKLMDECNVADHNLDMLLDAYDPNKQ